MSDVVSRVIGAASQGAVGAVVGALLSVEHVVVHVVSLGLKVAGQVDIRVASCSQSHLLRAVDVKVQSNLVLPVRQGSHTDFWVLAVPRIHFCSLTVLQVSDC